MLWGLRSSLVRGLEHLGGRLMLSKLPTWSIGSSPGSCKASSAVSTASAVRAKYQPTHTKSSKRLFVQKNKHPDLFI